MKKTLLCVASLLFSQISYGQNLDNMNWFNEPANWQQNDGTLEMQVTAKTDYWRKTHYGFTVDDGPFYYAEHGGEFEVVVKAIGDYQSRYDQMGLMLRIDEERWIKTGIEYVDGVYNFSTVATDKYSNWSVIALSEKPEAVWIKAVRRMDSVEIFYSLDGKSYQLSNLVHFDDNTPVKIGMMAASPDGHGFKARFEDFNIKHLPDARRLKWLENNK